KTTLDSSITGGTHSHLQLTPFLSLISQQKAGGAPIEAGGEDRETVRQDTHPAALRIPIVHDFCWLGAFCRLPYRSVSIASLIGCCIINTFAVATNKQQANVSSAEQVL